MRLIFLALAPLLLLGPLHARAADAVTEWTLLADRAGQGAANWRTLAIMHQAMHDAWNAALPAYARWHPATATEPPGFGAVPQIAMAAAARRVLVNLHPEITPLADQTYIGALQRTARTPLDAPSVALGEAVGTAAVARREGDGFTRRRLFPKQTSGGRWRPAPAEFSNSNTTETRPFLFSTPAGNPSVPPPAPGTEAFARGLNETLRIGGADSTERTATQTEAAIFWAYQSSQRGFIALGVSLLAAQPRPGGLAEHARIMSQLATAMADSAVLVWIEKEQYGYWRPITAIRELVPGQGGWEPLIPTPPHPEYPSGHAADCFTGAAVLQAALPGLRGPITYAAQPGRPPEDNVGMGQHSQAVEPDRATQRTFPSLAAAAEECSDSRIWSGAHFRPADEESRRLGTLIGSRATAAVPALR